MPRLAVTIDDHEFEIELDLLKRDGSALLARVNGEPVRIILPEADEPAGVAWMVIDDHPYEIALDGDLRWIRDENGAHAITVRDMDVLGRPPNLKDGRVKAPIPGQIARILVSVGQHVKAGEPLLILEAMKMENEIRSPRSGIVAAIHVDPQGNVARKDLLLEIQ